MNKLSNLLNDEAVNLKPPTFSEVFDKTASCKEHRKLNHIHDKLYAEYEATKKDTESFSDRKTKIL